MEVPNDPFASTAGFYRRARQDIMADAEVRGLPTHDMHAAAEKQPSLANELLFPNLFLLPLFGCIGAYRIRPLTPQTCMFEIWSLIPVPDGEPYESPKQARLLPLDSPEYPLIVHRDYYNMHMQQRGLASGDIEHQRTGTLQEGAISSSERLIDGYLAGLDWQQVTEAATPVNGGSFQAIADLGFGLSVPPDPHGAKALS